MAKALGMLLEDYKGLEQGKRKMSVVQYSKWKKLYSRSAPVSSSVKPQPPAPAVHKPAHSPAHSSRSQLLERVNKVFANPSITDAEAEQLLRCAEEKLVSILIG